MNIDNLQNFCIVGWGKSGISLCKLLLSLHKNIKITEIKERSSFPTPLIDKFSALGVKFEFGGHSEQFIKESQLIILSPGIDIKISPITAIANSLGIPSVGEVEFAFWLTKAKFVAITGTNGKTTTAFLVYRLLKEKKERVFLGGNIGIPVSSFILQTKRADTVVLEISSFQLETILEFRPQVACLLNIEPNHLDRHSSFNEYFEAKMNIFKNQKEGDWAVINQRLVMRKDIEKRLRSKVVYFFDEFPNEDYSCVYRIVSLFGLAKADCFKVFSGFKGLPHRLQFSRTIKGINFINDSKSTNPSSTAWALKNIKGPIILIAGGKDKGVDYTTITPYLTKVKKLNLFGQAKDKIRQLLSAYVEVEVFTSLKEAVVASYREAASGDMVLLSPMCSSFDMFSNYIERGRKFVEIVDSLGDE